MYFNVFGEKVSKARYREMVNAAKNRRELIAAGLTSRRDLLKMGLLSAGGMLVAKSGLSARAGQRREGIGKRVVSRVHPASNPQPLTNMTLLFDVSKAVLFDSKTEERLA